MSKFEPIASFEPHNQFRFICPIFGAETEFRVCMHLRDELWAGRKKEVRRGCQACLHDSKCPMVPIVQETFRSGEDPGYFAREKRVGGLHERHLRRIQNVVVMEKTMQTYNVPDNERLAIQAVSVYGAKLKGASLKPLEHVELPARKAAEKPIAKPSIPDGLVEAAKTGSLAAAINEATGGA